MLCVIGKSSGGQVAAIMGGGGGGGGGGSAIPVSIVWVDHEPSSWTLDITDKDGSVQSLSDSTSTSNVDFTQDGSTYHAYAFEFTQEGMDILNDAIAVNGSNGISSEYGTDSSEGGDPDSTGGTGITIHSGSTSLVLTIDITPPF